MEISAIMTVKNGQEFLLGSVGSIINQTVSPFEIVVVDDGSEDTTVTLLEEIKSKTNINIKIIKTNGVGRARALNLAVDNASGQWIANLDVDDFWHPRKLERQVTALQKYPSASLLITDTMRVYGEEDVNFANAVDNEQVSTLERSDFLLRNPVNHSSVMMKRDVLVQAGKYNEALERQIDIDLWVRLLSGGFKFYRVETPLTAKRIHKNQSFESKGRFRYSRGALYMGLRQLRELDAAWFYYPYPFLKFIYNMLPGFVRNVRKR